MKIAFVGPKVYFANHAVDGSQAGFNARFFHAEYNNLGSLSDLINFRPDLTYFYRPELYPPHEIEKVTGIKLAYLSEPLSGKSSALDRFLGKKEFAVRSHAYSYLRPNLYDFRLIYDKLYEKPGNKLGFSLSGSSPLPINGEIFSGTSTTVREIDILFVGKPTIHRIELLDKLRWSRFNFLWVAHGVSGVELANLMKRSKVVLNLHADKHIKAFEPRIDLALMAGAKVLSESMATFRRSLPNIRITADFSEDDLLQSVEAEYIDLPEEYLSSINLFTNIPRAIQGDFPDEEFFGKAGNPFFL